MTNAAKPDTLLPMMLLRVVLLIVVLVPIVLVALLARRVGLGEWGLLAGFLAWVIVVESALFIGRRFWRAYRQGATRRPPHRPE